jgi:hypothetical protein
VWIATPSPYETSIHNTLPVFPFYRRTEIRNKRWQTNPKYQIVQTSESARFEFSLLVI